ncbi:hypothetical protein KR044_006885, partial [Drosophila immigrans]
TFVACYKTTCEQDDMYRCGYGGCLARNKTCDGIKDCVDGSDENKFLCANETTIDAILDDLRAGCDDSYGLSCKVKSEYKCVKWSQICDGVIDCSDARDEGNELCSSSLCPDSFSHCQNGACISENSFCNHEVDCADGSDETPEICMPPPPPSVAFDPVPIPPSDKDSRVPNTIPESGKIPPISYNPPVQSIWKSNGCRLPQMPGMKASDYFTDFSYIPNTEVPLRTVVAVNCDKGYENFNSGINRCVDNEWANDFSCLRVCDQSPIIRNSRYVTQCTQGGSLGDCKVDTFISGTELLVTCAPGFQAVNKAHQIGKHICHNDGSWLIKEANPNCEAICGVRSIHHPTVTPWTVSIFERAYGLGDTYDFKCSGTILSRYVVVTAESCFDNQNLNDSHIYYSVVEGDHTVSYKQSEEHGYVDHYISDLHIVS